MSEQVNHPEHYGGADNPYEAIKVIEAWNLDFNLGNAVKYIARAGKKGTPLNGMIDLEKAEWYLKRFISRYKQKHNLVSARDIAADVIDASQIVTRHRDRGDAEEITVLMRAIEEANKLLLQEGGPTRIQAQQWSHEYFVPAINRNGYPSTK